MAKARHKTVFARLLTLPVSLFLMGWGLGMSAIGVTVGAESITGADPNARNQVVRGEYLARAGNCISCHTAAGGAPLAGGRVFRTSFGTFHSTNITPDAATGIGTWSEKDFRQALRNGVRPNGEHLYPVFPYTAYTQLTDTDIAAIFAYLTSQSPVTQAALPNLVGFPFNQRKLLGLWKALFFEPGEYRPDPDQSALWNRGAYLVQALAHCSACHSPRNILGAERPAGAMGGGVYLDRVPGGHYRTWSAPNLTATARGLGMWSRVDLEEYLKTSRNRLLEAFGPMNGVIVNGTSHLSEEDITAMAVYLKMLPGVEQPPGAAPDAGLMGRGRTVYNLHCGTCHLPTGEGDPEMAPRLNRGSLVVQSANPASLVNVILYGPELPDHGLPPRWREPMEPFQYLLDDQEVAAAATYIRNSWDNAAGVVTPQQVALQR